MTHAELTRDMQLERANLIAHLSACRRMLATAQGILQANQFIGDMTKVERDLLDRINAYLKVSMFDQLPEEIAR